VIRFLARWMAVHSRIPRRTPGACRFRLNSEIDMAAPSMPSVCITANPNLTPKSRKVQALRTCSPAGDGNRTFPSWGRYGKVTQEFRFLEEGLAATHGQDIFAQPSCRRAVDRKSRYVAPGLFWWLWSQSKGGNRNRLVTRESSSYL